jgi:DNA-binding CsgD family transcriptional regulator
VVSAVVAGEIYCKLMVACETVLDVPRAEQWHRVVTSLEDRLDVAWAPAICRMHVGTIWSAAGRWDDAERELTRSVELYDATYRALRPAACARLAELRVRQGRFAEADRLLAHGGSDRFGARPAAQVAWHRALTSRERDAAVAAFAEVLAQRDDDGIGLLPGLAALVELQLACGQTGAAAGSAARLVEAAARDVGEALTGYAHLTRGLVAAAASDPRAEGDLRAAVRLFGAARLPLEEARARTALARALTSEPGAALAQARRAAATFARLGASAELDRSAALVRTLGGRTGPPPRAEGLLTNREHDVLSLVAEGLSNPEVAQRLFLSRRTVAHHVSNLLAKLGVRNRGEAAAWFVAHEQQEDPPR